MTFDDDGNAIETIEEASTSRFIFRFIHPKRMEGIYYERLGEDKSRDKVERIVVFPTIWGRF